MPSLTPEQAFSRLGGLWLASDFQYCHADTLGGWIGLEYELVWETSRDVRDRFVAVCGLTASLAEFESVTGYSPRSWFRVAKWDEELTLGEFSVWLLENSSLPEIAPLKIAGTTCLPGGIFLGMAAIVERTSGRRRLRPGTRIADVLTPAQLERSLWQMQVACRRPIPNHPDPTALWSTLWLLMMPAGFLFLLAAVAVADNPTAGLFSGLVMIVSGFLLALLGVPKPSWFSTKSFLPPYIETFGDLARAFADQEELGVA